MHAHHHPEERLDKVIIPPSLSIAEAISVLDRSGLGILLVCDAQRKLLGVLTDGDVRRALLRSVPFQNPCLSIATRTPVVVPRSVTPAEALALMGEGDRSQVNHLPVVDELEQVVDLIMRGDLIEESPLGISAVVMAGGFGIRMHPFTQDTPKPMLSVEGKPLIEMTIEQLKRSGVHRVNITTHFKPEKIKEHFGNGDAFGVHIDYTTEESPLGTAGALGTMDRPTQTMLVINGDILTNVDFKAMAAYHRKHQADMTVAVWRHELEVPYGVIESEGPQVKRVTEKPKYPVFINAGIYLLEPTVYSHIPGRRRFDMTDLIDQLLKAGRTVVSFPIREYWLDIGQPEAYRQAQKDVKEGKV